MKQILYALLFCLIGTECGDRNTPVNVSQEFKLMEISIGEFKNRDVYTNVPVDAVVRLTFSDKVKESSAPGNIVLLKGERPVPLTIRYDANPVLELAPSSWDMFSDYRLTVNTSLKSETGAPIFTGKSFAITTFMDTTDKFPRISDEELLDLVQRQTFRYFWDFGHPVSGMARERTTSENTVTSGGTGFGLMAILVGIERAFITRKQGLDRLTLIVDFLTGKADKFHGAFSHWLHGETGKVIPFSANDNGGDLVETSFLMQGLLTVGEYFKSGNSEQEINLCNKIQALWKNVEWDWYRREGQNVLYWHWSPDKGWAMNHRITGWNECLITYVLAASSPTHSISKAVYDEGWAGNGAFRNGNAYYGFTLPLGSAYGGPLFFTHYSFLGLDPRNLSDSYAVYWTHNRNHSLINYKYCVENPKGYGGYSADCWGLTASDGNAGYSAHSPTNDKGVIAPTAALSALPYTTEESLQALRFFYYKLGDKLWSDYGFYDAFNLSSNWFDNQHIAIDQGPIIVMIENYRTALLWNLFMADSDIQTGLNKLGFSSL